MPHASYRSAQFLTRIRARGGARGPARRALTRALLLVVVLSTAAGFNVVGAGMASAAPGHNPVVGVDVAKVADGAVHFSGWAWDPDTTASVRVWFRVDGANYTAVLAHDPRPDVARVYPAAGDHRGFSAAFGVPNGAHQVCAVAQNVAAGADTMMWCLNVTMDNNPIGSFESLRMAPGGVQVNGWMLDPNTTSPVGAVVYVDGRPVGRVTANVSRPDIAAAFPHYGPAHGYSGVVPVVDGTHTVCIWGLNYGLGLNRQLPCRTISTTHSPLGNIHSSGRLYGVTDWVGVDGWSFDPDTASATQVVLTAKGVQVVPVTASRPAPNVASSYPAYGANHGYAAGLHLNGDQQQICAIAKNVGPGPDSNLGCFTIPSTGSTTPAAPSGLQAWPGNGSIDLTWTGATSTAAPVTGYTILTIPGNSVTRVSASARRATIPRLLNGHNYSFAITATNSLGTGSASWVTSAPSVIPPQFSPAPVSTSHYLRNLTNNPTTDASIGRAMGAADATYNPSGHRYLVLLQVGGQDEANKGALLSATTRFVSYAGVVTALKAYLDGYHSRQRPNAPVVVAVGTNNDVDVSLSAGLSWARNVVEPLRAYAARYPYIEIAGADDIEPGFSASAAASKQWLTGYLAGTPARFVFNGSADGCSTTAAARACNNGWTMADLQWLSGGAAASRIISLPQIYNYAMPLQWKFISLTGVVAGRHRVYFGGPLTEWTACAQAGSCGSITNVDAWNRLWAAISSSTATRQYDMPNGTDLRIN